MTEEIRDQLSTGMDPVDKLIRRMSYLEGSRVSYHWYSCDVCTQIDNAALAANSSQMVRYATVHQMPHRQHSVA
jgi:hypothetical protein